MEGPYRAEQQMRLLHELGVNFVIDNFGIAHSSMAYLKRFPVQKLKIDQSFVHGAGDNAENRAIVTTIINMGRSLNMDVVAEGVENEYQLNFLQRLECTYVQGLLFGDPMSAENYLELLVAQADGTDSYRALFA